MLCMVIAVIAAVTASVMEADTPELFLQGLSSAGPEEWVEAMAYEGNEMHPDSVRRAISELQDLSVEPGDRILEDFDGGYRAVFPGSRWTWRLEGGRIGSVTGETVVKWRPGGYRWVSAPVFSHSGSTIGPRERLCAGATAMGAVVLVGVIAVWYAKRRYG